MKTPPYVRPVSARRTDRGTRRKILEWGDLLKELVFYEMIGMQFYKNKLKDNVGIKTVVKNDKAINYLLIKPKG